MSSGGGNKAKLPDPAPVPIEVDAKKAQEDVKKRLDKAKGRSSTAAAGFLSTPPMVSNLALTDTLG